MKLVSPKTLLASLLGCTFVVMKVMTFDGLVDMFWIILIGYLTVKAIVTAFSQEAYDEDISRHSRERSCTVTCLANSHTLQQMSRFF